MKAIISTATLSFLLLGCATSVPSIDYAIASEKAVAEATIVHDSGFDVVKTVVAPELHKTIQVRKGFLDIPGLDSIYDEQTVLLRGFKDKTAKTTTHQIYLVIRYRGDWRYYTSASFIGGEQKLLKALKREVIGCSGRGSCILQETLGIEISEDALRTGKGGINVRVNSKSGFANEIVIPQHYIVGYLLKSDAA